MRHNKEKRLAIALIWQNGTPRIDKWHDGLRAALELLKADYDIDYIEPTDDFEPYDILIYWESPCTINSEYRDNYLKVMNSPKPTILLFAGGQIMNGWANGFNRVCIESQINIAEFLEVGIKTSTAFGINSALFKPYKVKKEFNVVHHGTCANWKRQSLVAESFGEKALLIGRYQPHDPLMFDKARELGATVLDELNHEELVKKLCSAQVLLQTSDFWGGGQRCTLEGMACGLPVICMTDSPKNREYVEESGAGIVCDPNPEAIRLAYDKIMEDYDTYSKKGIEYVKSKWTEKHYADNLKTVIESL